jgi:hypothetical protein
VTELVHCTYCNKTHAVEEGEKECAPGAWLDASSTWAAPTDGTFEVKLGTEWTCHFCGDSRPDEKISAATVESKTNTGVEIRHNRRYCNDRLACRRAAAKWKLRGDPFAT